MHRKSRIILIFIILAVLVCGVLYLLFACPTNEEEGDVSGAEPVVQTPEDNSGQANAFAEEAASYWYYDSSRLERYEAFAADRSELTTDEVVWMVNADLDNPPYTDAHEVPDPDSYTLLVNKHFYLPEGFVPADLETIGGAMLRKDAVDAAKEMFSAASAEGHYLWAQSGFRSYEIQVSLYDQYSARDGEEAADTYSARPGYSEHQTGLTMDLNTITEAFGETAEGKWAAQNCWVFGFIVRYTNENTDVTLYKTEPWHLRYIGKDAAAEMHALGLSSFEEYWVKYIQHPPEDTADVDVPEQDAVNADGEDAGDALVGRDTSESEPSSVG